MFVRQNRVGLAVQADLSLERTAETVEQVEKSSLAATGFPFETYDLAPINGEIDPREDRGFIISKGEIYKFNHLAVARRVLPGRSPSSSLVPHA